MFDIFITDIHDTRYVYFSEYSFVEKNIRIKYIKPVSDALCAHSTKPATQKIY